MGKYTILYGTQGTYTCMTAFFKTALGSPANMGYCTNTIRGTSIVLNVKMYVHMEGRV